MRNKKGGERHSSDRPSTQPPRMRQLKKQQLLQLQELSHVREGAVSHTQQLLKPTWKRGVVAVEAAALVEPVRAALAPERPMRPRLLDLERPLCGVRDERPQPKDWRAEVK